jgi:hypothetical protein
MIKGAKFWDDPQRYYTQENNPTESFLKATLDERREWLESCGPTAAVNCLSVIGANINVICPGEYRPQPEEVLMDFFNDPRNRRDLKSIREVSNKIPGNRVPQYYPLAVRKVFGAYANFAWEATLSKVSKYLLDGHAVQLCLKDPGHYIAAVAFDTTAQEIIYNDSWPNRFYNGRGWNIRMGLREFVTNVQPYCIVYG